MSICKWMDKEKCIHTYTYPHRNIMWSLKRKPYQRYNVDTPWKHCPLSNKLIAEGHKLYDSIPMRIWCLVGIVSVLCTKKVLEIANTNIFNTLKMVNMLNCKELRWYFTQLNRKFSRKKKDRTWTVCANLGEISSLK